VKTLSTISRGVGIITLLFLGYTLLKGVPDLGRYIKISRM
jgi:hypothetical protein